MHQHCNQVLSWWTFQRARKPWREASPAHRSGKRCVIEDRNVAPGSNWSPLPPYSLWQLPELPHNVVSSGGNMQPQVSLNRNPHAVKYFCTCFCEHLSECLCVCACESVREYVCEAVTCTPKGNEHDCTSSQCDKNRRHHTIDISAPGWPIIMQSQSSASPNYNHFNKIMSFLLSSLHNDSRSELKRLGEVRYG